MSDFHQQAVETLTETVGEHDKIYCIMVDTKPVKDSVDEKLIRFFHQPSRGNGRLFDITRLVARALKIGPEDFREQRSTGNWFIACDDDGFDNVYALSRLLFPDADKPGYSLTHQRL